MTFTNKQLEKYADVLIWGLETARSGRFKAYDTIQLAYQGAAQPLAEALYARLLERKRNVILRPGTGEVMEHTFYAATDAKQRKFINKGVLPLAESLNGAIHLRAPESLTHLKDIDPKRMAEVAVARKPLRKVMEKREEKGLFGWTLCMYPTEELAKQAGMSIADYAGQIKKACFLQSPDPVQKWKDIYRDAISVKKWLYGLKIETLRVESKHTDLEVRLGEKRRFVGLSGHNIPSFEIFTSPDWRGTRGTYYADFPSFRNGNYIEGVTLVFEKGRVVKSKAKKGAAFVAKMVGMDRGAAQLGEFSLTDKRFSKIDRFMANTLFDENIGGKHGNCHVAIGSSYSDAYDGDPSKLTAAAKKKLGFNDSALHWDLISTEKKMVTARCKGGREVVVYEDGTFAV